MRRIQQCAQCAGDGGSKATDEVRETDRVGTAPRDELELNQPVELLHALVALFPVPVQAHDFGGKVVDHQDVGREFAFRFFVVLQLQHRVDVVYLAYPVVVLLELPTLDLVVRLLGFGYLGLQRRLDDIDVPVQPAGYPVLERLLRYVLHLSYPLRGVEVNRRER